MGEAHSWLDTALLLACAFRMGGFEQRLRNLEDIFFKKKETEEHEHGF